MMIARMLNGPMVTLIVTLPDAAGHSTVITLWPSTVGEQRRYLRGGGARDV